MTIRELIESASRSCDQIFRETGEILPMWHTVDAKDQHGIWATPMIDKGAVIEGMRQKFADEQIVRYVFMTEAWTTPPDPEIAKRGLEWMQSGKRLETFPERVEVLMFSGEDIDGGCVIAHRKIIRNQGGPKLGPLEWYESGMNSGRMIGLLRKQTAH